MIHWSELRVDWGADGKPVGGEITFSHEDDVTGKVRHFAVERMVKWVNEHPMERYIIPIDPIFAKFAFTCRGVEMHRLTRITPADVAAYPIIMVRSEEFGRDDRGTATLMVDGTHRYCAAAAWGWKEIPAYIFEEGEWERFLIDVPDFINEHTSERLTAQKHGTPIDSRIK